MLKKRLIHEQTVEHTFPPFDIKVLASSSNSFSLLSISLGSTLPLYSTNGLCSKNHLLGTPYYAERKPTNWN